MTTLEKFLNEELVVSCKSEEEAEEFITWMLEHHPKYLKNWGEEPMETNWERYKVETLYGVENGSLLYGTAWGWGKESISLEDFMLECEEVDGCDYCNGEDVVDIDGVKYYLVGKTEYANTDVWTENIEIEREIKYCPYCGRRL